MIDRHPEWTARYNEASEAFMHMRATERRTRRDDIRAAYRRAGDDAQAVCCVMLRGRSP